MKARQVVLHPFLFALYSVLALLSVNIDQLSALEALRSVVFVLVMAGIVLSASRWFLGDWPRAALMSTLFLVLFFSYGHIYHLIEGKTIGGFIIGRHRYLAPIWLLLFGIGTLWIWRKVRESDRMTTFLNLFATFALIMPLYNLADYLILSNRSELKPLELTVGTIEGVAPRSSETLPDIYYIILDAYARADILDIVYDYDNSPFINALESRGFFIASGSHSNYTQTTLSVASTLNLNYIEELVGRLDPRNTDLTPLGSAIDQSLVRTTLEELGYTTIAFDSGFSKTEIEDVDLYLFLSDQALNAMDTFGSINMFEGMLIQTSLGVLAMDAIHLLPEQLQPDLEYPYRAHRERILFAFENLVQLPETDTPKFVFLHIVSPHQPFVFGPNGEKIRHSDAYTLKDGVFLGDRQTYVQSYTDQLSYLNSRTLEAIDQLLAQSARPVVILLQSDHGPGATAVGEEPAPISYLIERMSILNAFRLPDCETEGLYPTITSVNTFRAVFNFCFGIDIEILEDKIFASNYNAPYDLVEVTERLK